MGDAAEPGAGAIRPRPIRHDHREWRARKDRSVDPAVESASEKCLRRLGVPAFAGRGAFWKNGRIVPLMWMLAFEVGCAAWVVGPVQALVVAAPIVALLAFLTRSLSTSLLGIEQNSRGWWLLPLLVVPIGTFFLLRDSLGPLTDTHPSWQWLHPWSDAVTLAALYAAAGPLMPLLVVPIGTLFLLRDSLGPLTDTDPIWLWPHPWSDAAVTLAALYAAAVLLLPQARGRSGWQVRLLWVLLISVALATIFFTAAYPITWAVGGVVEHSSFWPLCFAAVVLAIVLVLPKVPGPNADTSRSSFPLTEATTLLVLIFGLLNGFLIHFVNGRTGTVIVSVIVLAIVAAVGLVRWSSKDRSTRAEVVVAQHANVPQRIDEPRLRIWIPAFMFAYPAITLVFYGDDTAVVRGRELSAWELAGALLLFNAGFVLLVWLLASFGVYYVMGWAGREFLRKAGDIVRQMAESAPLLLMFVAFFALTAETWQVAYRLTRGTLMAVLVLLLALALVLVLGWTIVVLRRESAFPTWGAVADQLANTRQTTSPGRWGRDCPRRCTPARQRPVLARG